MERRNFLNTLGTVGIGLGTAALAAQRALISDAIAAEAVPAKNSGVPATQLSKLAETAAECVSRGQACTQHCIDMMAAGDSTMGACAKATYEMTAACETIARMARGDSPHLKEMAKIASELCKSCEAACRKHGKSMEVCAKCADSCAACAKLCDQISA